MRPHYQPDAFAALLDAVAGVADVADVAIVAGATEAMGAVVTV